MNSGRGRREKVIFELDSAWEGKKWKHRAQSISLTKERMCKDPGDRNNPDVF